MRTFDERIKLVEKEIQHDPGRTGRIVGSKSILLGILLEARVGIEPTHKGFADLSLTTWVPRLSANSIAKLAHDCQCCGDGSCGICALRFPQPSECGPFFKLLLVS